MHRQQTLAEAVSCSGVGLHSGEAVRLRLLPAPPDSGVVFECAGGAALPARIDRVVESDRATSLGVGDARVQTVGHLLAAFYGLGVDNVRAVVEGPELPAMDGSASAYVYLLRSAGRVEQDAPRRVLRLRKAIELREGAGSIRAVPAPGLSVRYAIDFAHPLVGRQSFRLASGSPEEFEREIAGARTFGFRPEAESLRRAGFARGASPGNTLVFGAAGLENPGGLRFPDECVRHRLLDLLGDLALLGVRLEAHVEVERGGHALHLALVRALAAATSSRALESALEGAKRRRLARWSRRVGQGGPSPA